MLLKHQNSLELLQAVVTLFVFPGVAGSVPGQTRLGNKLHLTKVAFEVLVVVQPDVGGEVWEHVDLHARPAEPPAAWAALHRHHLIGRVLETLLLVTAPGGPRRSHAGLGDEMSDKTLLGGKWVRAVGTHNSAHHSAPTGTLAGAGGNCQSNAEIIPSKWWLFSLLILATS